MIIQIYTSMLMTHLNTQTVPGSLRFQWPQSPLIPSTNSESPLIPSTNSESCQLGSSSKIGNSKYPTFYLFILTTCSHTMKDPYNESPLFLRFLLVFQSLSSLLPIPAWLETSVWSWKVLFLESHWCLGNF